MPAPIAVVTGRIVAFETRSTSKGGAYVSLSLDQDGATLYASAFDGASIDGDAVVLPAVAGGDRRHAKGDVVTLRVRVGAYANAKGRSYASFTVLGTVDAA
jgi:uncharacterized protein YjlB